MDLENAAVLGDEKLDEVNEELDETEDYIKMDYSLEEPKDRVAKVNEIIEKTPPERLTSIYLTKLSDYIIDAVAKKEKIKLKQTKEKNDIITDNRMVTLKKREMSFEGLVGKLENGEDGIYSMMAENDKNIIFQPKVSITQKDLDEVPGLRELREAIDNVENQSKNARGRKAFILKKMLIELRQDQYVLKNAYRRPIYMINKSNFTKTFAKLNLDEEITITKDGDVESTGLINFFNESHISALLCNYSRLKEESWDKFNSDSKWMMMDLDNLTDNALKEKYPMYYDLLIYKIDGKQNIEIQELLYQDYGIKHSVEYISSLWRNKIPKLIVEQAKKEYLIWYYTYKEKGNWKKCSRCGQIKLAHNFFFSKNSTSKDGYYSICKECRNKKTKG